MKPNHYATLGVAPDASAAEIRAAYLRLMREYHPDRNQSPEAGERARSVIAAFKVLSDFDQRSHYDWDRRRARERAAALTAMPDRTLDKKAVVVGLAGAGCVVAAMAGWSMIMPQAAPPVEATVPVLAQRAEGAASDNPDPLPPARPARRSDPAWAALPGETVIRMRPVLPPRPSPTVAHRLDPARPVLALRDPPRRAAAAAERKPPERASKAPAPIRARVAAKRPMPAVQPSKAVVRRDDDLAALDQFVMAFYGQSWRYGDARKRAALKQSHGLFTSRRAACVADSCRRDAYLHLQRDVSSIVESGEPAR